MFTSVLFIGIQLLRLETNCKIFLYHFYHLISIIILSPKPWKYLKTLIYSMIRWSVILMFVVIIVFDSWFGDNVFDRSPIWEMLRFLAATIRLSGNPKTQKRNWIYSINGNFRPSIWYNMSLLQLSTRISSADTCKAWFW